MTPSRRQSFAIFVFGLIFGTCQDQPVKLEVHWDKVVRVSQTATTLQVVVNPPLRRGTPVHNNAYRRCRSFL